MSFSYLLRSHRNALSHYSRLALLLTSAALSGCGMNADTDTEHLEQAKKYLSKNDHNTAAIELKIALQKNPKNAEARFLLGKHYILQGDGKSAEKEIRLARKYGFKNNESFLYEIKALLAQGKYDEILTELATPDIKPSELSSEISAIRAEAFYATNQNKDAQNTLTTALSKDPESVSLLTTKAIIDIADKHVDSAYQSIEKALATHPNNSKALQTKGDLDFSQGKYAEARSAYQKILNKEFSNPNTVSRLNAKLGLTKTSIAIKDFKTAKADIDGVMKVIPDNPTANHLQAIISYSEGDLENALQYIHKTLKAFPKHTPANMLAGAAYFQTGRFEQASQVLKQAVAQAPNNIPARKLLATTYLKINQPEKAKNILLPAVTNNASDTDLLAMVGDAALKMGNFDEGARYLRKASLKKPDSSAIREKLAVAYLNEGNIDRAIDELDQNIKNNVKDFRSRILLANTHAQKGNTNKATGILSALIIELPNNPIPENELGNIYSNTGKIDKARNHYQKALDKNNSFIPAKLNLARLELKSGKVTLAKNLFEEILSSKPNQKDALVDLAEINAKLGNKTKAFDALEKARNLYPDFIPPRVILTQLYLHDKNILQAKTVINEALRINPKDPKVKQGQGMVALASGNTNKAATIFSSLSDNNPTAENYFHLAQAQAAGNQPRKALSTLNSALKKEATHIPSLTLLSLLNLAMGNKPAAIKQYEKIITIQPNNLVALNNLAILLLDTNKAKSLKLATLAYQQDSSAPYADTLGWTLLKNGKTSEALTHLKEANLGEPDAPSISYHLAAALAESGKKGEAKKILNKLVSSGKRFQEMGDAKSLLASLQ